MQLWGAPGMGRGSSRHPCLSAPLAPLCGGGTGPLTLTSLLSLTEEELRKLREETNAEMLRQELDRERQRRMELEQKVQEVLKAR